MNSRCTFEGAVAWDGVLAWFVLGGVGGESLGGAFLARVVVGRVCTALLLLATSPYTHGFLPRNLKRLYAPQTTLDSPHSPCALKSFLCILRMCMER